MAKRSSKKRVKTVSNKNNDIRRDESGSNRIDDVRREEYENDRTDEASSIQHDEDENDQKGSGDDEAGNEDYIFDDDDDEVFHHNDDLGDRNSKDRTSKDDEDHPHSNVSCSSKDSHERTIGPKIVTTDRPTASLESVSLTAQLVHREAVNRNAAVWSKPTVGTTSQEDAVRTAPFQSGKRKRVQSRISANQRSKKAASGNLPELDTRSSISIGVTETDEIYLDEQSDKKVSSVWKYASRTEDKTFATSKLCGKKLSTSSWSMTSLRRHLVQVHNLVELDVGATTKTNDSLTVTQSVRQKLNQLCIEAIVKDNLSFNAFQKPGLSKLLKLGILGEKRFHC